MDGAIRSGHSETGHRFGKSNSFGDPRMTLKVYHAVPKVPDVVATTAAEVL